MATHKHAERGAVTLLVALMLPVLLGIAALVIDVAYVRSFAA
jgi:Flp pilus assembly protein TadG